MNRNVIVAILSLLILGSCIFGSSSVVNPKRAGRTPNFSKEDILLGELTSYRSCFDVHYYDFSLTVDPDKELLDGFVEIHATAMEDFDTLQLDLSKNFEITSLTDHTTNLPLEYYRDKRAVFVKSSHKKGENFIIRVAYNGNPKKAKKAPWKGGFVWDKDYEDNPWIGVACESDGASIWWPLKDHTSDEADSVRLHYTVPNGLIAVGNGQFECQKEIGDKTTYNWFISYPINSYNITIYVGKFKLLKDEYTGISGKKLALNHYVLDRDYSRAKKHFQQLHSILKNFELLFGEYPWYRDGYKLVQSPYAGMEHQSAIAYGNGFRNDASEDIDYIILHETAHEWWGNSISAKDLADVWLQEGFATYAEALYFEKLFGEQGYHAQLLTSRSMIKNKYPVVGIKGRRWFHFRKNADVYGKGAWFLHTLRSQMADDALFLEMIHTFYNKYAYQIIETKEFKALVNEMAPANYDWLFDQYLSDNFVPSLEYASNDQGQLFYKWGNMDENFDKLRIDIWSKNKLIGVYPSSKIQRLDLEKDKYGNWDFRLDNFGALIELKKNEELLKAIE